MKIILKKLTIVLIPILFFITAFITLKDYGISWDEPIHFNRGQAYLYYFLTGKITYKKIEVRQSFYQNQFQNGAYFLQNDGGHPPANDIMAAFTNYIFYQKLGILGDIDSYHLFNISASTLLIVVIALFAYETMGLFPAIISSLTVAFYPLFFAESHFNIKDPPQTAFFALTLWLFWLSLKKFNWKLLALSGISCGLCFAIKFNVIFLPFILIFYLALRYFPASINKKIKLVKIPRMYLRILFLLPVLVFGILFVSWPYLWQDPIINFPQIIHYYKEIGTGANYQNRFIFPGGFNLYPLFWIIITTPPFTLLLTVLGLFFIFKGKKLDDKTEFLWLFWFLIPIIRVSLPGMTIYGGIRQIMEYLPAMALICGYGVFRLAKLIKKGVPIQFLAISGVLISGLFIIIRLHPNENVYFNFLIGGLKGAKEENIPYWGNSFGNAYLQGVKWLNVNAEKGAGLALVQGTMSNIPQIQLRPDINYSNSYWSGIDRKGEYLIELTYNDSVRAYPYVWDYINKFLIPVYEVKIDGVAIAKVWKNDLQNTYQEFWRKESLVSERQFSVLKKDNIVTITLNQPEEITRVKINYSRNLRCSDPKGVVDIAGNNGLWFRKEEQFPNLQMYDINKKDNFSYFFPADKTSGIRFIFENTNSCALIKPNVYIYALR